MDWAPDASRPGLVALADPRGGVTLVALADCEEWASHMAVWHYRGSLRQAVGSVGATLRSKTGRLAGAAVGAAGAALSEAKFLVKDVKDSGLVRGVLGFFGR